MVYHDNDCKTITLWWSWHLVWWRLTMTWTIWAGWRVWGRGGSGGKGVAEPTFGASKIVITVIVVIFIVAIIINTIVIIIVITMPQLWAMSNEFQHRGSRSTTVIGGFWGRARYKRVIIGRSSSTSLSNDHHHQHCDFLFHHRNHGHIKGRTTLQWSRKLFSGI